MFDIALELASDEDAEPLTLAQRRAFDLEAESAGMVQHRGPSGYDRTESTRLLIKQGRMHKAVLEGKIVGGAVVTLKDDGVGRINRIFVEPAWQRRGIGHSVIKKIILAHPEIVRWGLDTPDWSVHNQRFYEGLGFRQVKKIREPVTGFMLIDYILEVNG